MQYGTAGKTASLKRIIGTLLCKSKSGDSLTGV
jgi:hypothetical protein